LAERGQARSFQLVAVEEVVGVEGDEAPVGVDDVDAGFLSLRTSKVWASMNCMIMMRKMLS
jgi:hypothetical protein